MGDPPPNGVPDWSVTASEPSQTVQHPAKPRKKGFKLKKSTPVALFMAKIRFWWFSGSRRPEKRISPPGTLLWAEKRQKFENVQILKIFVLNV